MTRELLTRLLADYQKETMSHKINIKEEIDDLNKSIELAKDVLISQLNVFWVIEMIGSFDFSGQVLYMSRMGWTPNINLAKKFISREDAEYYINRKDPILIGMAIATEHAYF